MSSTTPLISEKLVRPAVAGGVAFALDRFVLGQTNPKKGAVFAGSVAIGVAVGSMAGDLIPNSSGFLGNGKQIGSRFLEVSASGATAFVVDKFILKNDTDKKDLLKRAAVILVADVASEYAVDYMAGRSLQFFA